MADKPEDSAPPAEPPAAESGEEWETLRTGLGREWKFENDAPLIGTWVGVETVPLTEPREDGATEATAYIFADNNGEQIFLWTSSELETAMTQAGIGDKLRISSLGIESFTGKDGPRQIKRFKVERAVRAT